MNTAETTPDSAGASAPRPPKAWKIIGVMLSIFSVWCLVFVGLALGYAYYLHLHSLR